MAQTEHPIDIPAFLLKGSRPVGREKIKVHTGFLKKTLSGLLRVYENEFYSEKYAMGRGFLQSVDARVKFLTLFFFMLLGAFSHSVTVLLLLTFTAVLYAALSGLPLHDYIRRVWAYIPPLIFVFSLPAATGFFSAGAPLLTLIRLPGFSLYFTLPGLLSALRLALRAGVSLSMGYLLIITTRWSGLMKAFESMHIPPLFTAVLSMAYRYIFLLCDNALVRMHARWLRTVGHIPAVENRRFFARNTAFLFVKTGMLSDEIYNAMVCRGYTGKNVSLEALKIGRVDILFIINNTIVIIILLLGERLF